MKRADNFFPNIIHNRLAFQHIPLAVIALLKSPEILARVVLRQIETFFPGESK